MKEIIHLGLDLAKRKLHLVGINPSGEKILSKQLSRKEVLPYLKKYINGNKGYTLAMEGCGGCHYWAREITKLGYVVKILKTGDVKVYSAIRQKNDINDAHAIAKASLDKDLREIRAKTVKEQEMMLLHKQRSNVQKHRTMKSNSIMSSLHEFGYVTKCRKGGFGKRCIEEIEMAHSEGYLSKEALELFLEDAKELKHLYEIELVLEKKIIKQNALSEDAKLLKTIKGIGDINASLLSTLPVTSYDSAKDFAASLGLVPSQHSSGGKMKLGRITKRGNRYARAMLIQGARNVVKRSKVEKDPKDKIVKWGRELLKTKSFNKTSVAVANKIARVVYAVLNSKQAYCGNI